MRARLVRILAIAAGTVSLAGAAYYASSRGHAPSATTNTAQAAEGLRMQPAAGTRHTYALVWSADTTRSILGGNAFRAELRLEADLVVRSLGQRDGLSEIVMSLEDIRGYELKINGRSALSEAVLPAEKAALAGREALVRIDSRGQIKSLSFSRDAEPKAREVLTKVIEATRVTLPENPHALTWEATETTPIGTARSRYVLSPEDAHTLVRDRLSYSVISALGTDAESQGLARTLNARSIIKLDASSNVSSIADDEDLVVRRSDGQTELSSRTTVSLSTKGKSTFDVRDIKVAALDQPRDLVGAGADTHSRDMQLAASVDPAAAEAVIRSYSATAELPSGFVGHVGSYLRLHPEETDRLGRLFVLESTTGASRCLIADVLSVAGDAAAQAELRAAVTSPAAKRDRDVYADLLQRVFFLETPEPASVAVVADAYEAARKGREPGVALAAAVALGGFVRKLTENGQKELATKYHARLVEDLGTATGNEERIALLRGLGNAAESGDVEILASHATNPAPLVRDQVAMSLRNLDTPRARELLFTLAQDPNTTVATGAFRALSTQTLNNEDWARLAGLVSDEKANRHADRAAVSLVNDQRDVAGESGSRILRAILARTHGDRSDLRSKIEQMLAAEAG